jgi:hypothetical protein
VASVRRTPGAETILRALDAEGRICLDHFAATASSFTVTLSQSELRILREQGLSIDLGRELATRSARDDVGGAIGAPVLDDAGALDALTTGFTSAYLDAAQVAAQISALAASFPALCQLTTLPETTTGYDGSVAALTGPASVQLLRITNTPAVHNKPGMLLICGTHAREWINPLIAIEFAAQLLNNYNPASMDPDVVAINRIVEQCDTFIIPVLNPDGHNFSIHDSAGWRKNRNPADSMACPGIDNNRNYEVYFGGAGSSASTCSDSYRGSSAFSERENRNVRHVLEQFPNILTGVDSHSYGQAIFRPQPTGGTFIASLPVAAADHAIYTTLENTVRAAIQAVNGVTYSTGTTSNHAGTSDEYMFFGHRVFGFDFECALDFQPPFATAQMAIQEVTAGMRALANATIDLTVTTPSPARIVQAIDRTGSMVAFGYEAPARANARRFIDMMSLGDSIGVVSFADPSPNPMATPPALRAITELPLTLIDDPGDFATARASVDGIAFGGWTPIGAGLQRSADLLTGAPAPRAVLLISDGYENRDPTVANVLTTFPADLRVFTVALGAASDATLLQSIASDTGGQFYMSPTALDLHDGLVLNDTVDAAEAPGAVHVAEVEHGADKLLISVSWAAASTKPKQRKRSMLSVYAPSGRKVRGDDWGVKMTQRADYALVEILRPPPGSWLIDPHGPSGPHTAAAFVKSPLRLRVPQLLDKQQLQLLAFASFEDRPLNLHAGRAALATLPPKPTAWLKRQRKLGPGWADKLTRKEIAALQAPKPIEPRHVPLELRRPPSLDGTAHATAPQLVASLPSGRHNVKLQIEGTLPGGAPFRRVVLRTVVA